MSGHSRGGPLDTDRPTAENPGEKFTAHGTRRPRQARPTRHAFGHAFLVVARTGRLSLCMVVTRCSGCEHAHRFTAVPTFRTGVRTAPCGARFVLHALLEQEAAA